jgi:glycosyltransferase involved in cell wall biosynthesis
MKIVFDHQIFSSQKFGGVSRYFVELLNGVNKVDGVNAELVAPLHCNDYLVGDLSERKLRIRNWAKIYRVIQPINNVISRPILKFKKPDIVHETYYQYKTVAPKNTPIVLTAYDLIHEKYHSTFRVKDETTLRKRAALRRADHIIAISESTRRDYIEFFNVHPAKITTVHLASSFNLALSNQLEYAIDVDVPFLLYVGGRKGYKNFDAVLAAYGNSHELKSDFKLVCFGGGDFNADELVNIERLGLTQFVLYRSGADDLLRSYYRKASVFVYSSLYEGFGLPPLEAMALGCPVVCTDRSSVPEVVGDAAVLFDPTFSEAIEFAIKSVVYDSVKRKGLIASGYSQAQKFTWKSCVDKTVEIYKNVLL